ncbi:FGGY-family carbohydrate kinase [Thiocystis violascens]|uniref:Pentulose/hexulose kinase n=1 Tax=Thiocystis violascens (strain ATCC 17096 / DSM 198 / 6111) TaxID=765911 RepID=I3YBT4_THIV6|nr:FGGY-family carbohydrate kinase [Thiocystis violascens]AFL74452.1 pentulose/hexulose kinase [Thiocystis violascens DSM 198]
MRNTSSASFIGLDLGTSGCRAVVLNDSGTECASARIAMPPPLRLANGGVEQDPELWWQAARTVLKTLGETLCDHPPAAICVDATSATLLIVTPDGRPLGPALMYNDRRAVAAAARIERVAPADSPARGPGSSLAKLIALREGMVGTTRRLALHQADWIIGRLTGKFGHSDWNNALKLGYDAEHLCWPDWVRDLLPAGTVLPRVVAPGTPLGRIAPEVASEFGFPTTTQILAGTTDSTAAVIAAGAQHPGDAVTSLGSTLVVKIVAERPVSASQFGVYSHRFGEHWLVGGASNSGGSVLRQFFGDDEIADLSRVIDPDTPSGLNYYPLPGTGERFPRHEPGLESRLQTRPSDPVRFLHGLLEGIAAIEAEGYARLAELGAPRPTRVITVGGGAANPTWTRLRARMLGVEVIPAEHREAAFGAAWLALQAFDGSSL